MSSTKIDWEHNNDIELLLRMPPGSKVALRGISAGPFTIIRHFWLPMTTSKIVRGPDKVRMTTVRYSHLNTHISYKTELLIPIKEPNE
jgi:hypothetical protein